jgi:5'-deoxynucleotidase YfbR-like HD superfamily hydrolase
MSPWIQTASGLKFPLLEIDRNAILIEDIAHALSMLCRFNAQCLKFYSVAEHSVHVSHEIAPELALVGLMHDAAEAYIGDVPSPLKKHLTQFQVIEERLIAAIAKRYGFAMPEDGSDDARELKRADVQLLVDEKAAIMAQEPEAWPSNAPPLKNSDRIKCWSSEIAKARFMARFEELQKV